MKVFIYTPSYNENSGGVIVLHRLCHLINSIDGNSSFIVKAPSHTSHIGLIKKLRLFAQWNLIGRWRYKVNNDWNTPIWKSSHFPQDGIVIYPEIANGNPLKIKNVVRWLLHQPGFHTNNIQYGQGELYFKFNSAIDDFHYEGSTLSKNELKVIYYPIELYNSKEDCDRNIETCYMVRKGGYKKFVHDESSILLDGKSHKEISYIFKRTRRFICYDDYTAYSIFAALSGCISVVIPQEGKSIDDWYPNENDRYGIAYGLSSEQVSWASNTKDKVLEHVTQEHANTERKVLMCLNEIKKFFHLSD